MVKPAYIAAAALLAVAAAVVAAFLMHGFSSSQSITAQRFPKCVTLCVFGAEGCGHCSRFKAWLSRVGARFAFCNIMTNKTCIKLLSNLIRIGVPSAVPISVVTVRYDGGRVFAYVLVGELENMHVWINMKPKIVNGEVEIPKYVGSQVTYMTYNCSYVPLYGSNGESVRFIKWLPITPSELMKTYCTLSHIKSGLKN